MLEDSYYSDESNSEESDEEEESESYEEQNSISLNSYLEGKEKIKQERKAKMFKILVFFYDFFSWERNFKYFIYNKKDYFNEDKIEIINYYKTQVIFLLTFNSVFYTGIIFPHRDYFNVTYFNSYYLVFDKLVELRRDLQVRDRLT